MSTWAVTGATGFIGRELCRQLIDRGDEVRGLTRPGGTRELAGLRDIRICPTDLGDPDAVAHALSGCEEVAHLAAPRRPSGGTRDSGARAEGTALMTDACETLIEAAARAGARRLVLASSTAVYGHPWDEVDEDSAARPDTPYGQARLIGERRARARADRCGLELTIARLSEVYGPGSVGHRALVEHVLAGGFRVIGDGHHPHQMIHVADAARALDACGRQPGAANATVLVSGPRVTFREWIGSIATAADVAVTYTPSLTIPIRVALRSLPKACFVGRWQTLDYHVRPRAYAVDRSLRLLGPYQRVSLEQGVPDLVRQHLEDARS